MKKILVTIDERTENKIKAIKETLEQVDEITYKVTTSNIVRAAIVIMAKNLGVKEKSSKS